MLPLAFMFSSGVSMQPQSRISPPQKLGDRTGTGWDGPTEVGHVPPQSENPFRKKFPSPYCSAPRAGHHCRIDQTSEWGPALASKSSKVARLSWVQIPPLPLVFIRLGGLSRKRRDKHFHCPELPESSLFGRSARPQVGLGRHALLSLCRSTPGSPGSPGPLFVSNS